MGVAVFVRWEPVVLRVGDAVTAFAKTVASVAAMTAVALATACAGADDHGADPGNLTKAPDDATASGGSSPGGNTESQGASTPPSTGANPEEEESGDSPGAIQDFVWVLPTGEDQCVKQLKLDSAADVALERLQAIVLCFADQGWIASPSIRLTLPDGSVEGVRPQPSDGGGWQWGFTPGLGDSPVDAVGDYRFVIPTPSGAHGDPPTSVAPTSSPAAPSGSSTSTPSGTDKQATSAGGYSGLIRVKRSSTPRLVAPTEVRSGGTLPIALAGYEPGSDVEMVVYGPGVGYPIDFPRLGSLPAATAGVDLGEAESDVEGSYGHGNWRIRPIGRPASPRVLQDLQCLSSAMTAGGSDGALGSLDAAATTGERKPIDWLVGVAAPLLGLIGAVLYGVLRLSYMFFYLQLRTTPEEVGYGYAEILATQLVGAIELVLIFAVLIFVSVITFHYVRGRVPTLGRAGGGSVPLKPSRVNVWRLGRRSAVAAVLVVVVLLPTFAWLMGAEAKKGYAVRNVYPRGMIALPILAVQAVPARVSPVSDSGPAALFAERECLLYLGSNDGTAVFYDVSTGESIRLPSSAVSIVLPFWSRVKHGC